MAGNNELVWNPCHFVNQCYIPELNDFYGEVLITYETMHRERFAKQGHIDHGLLPYKKINGIPIAYMYMPEPYMGMEVTE